MPKKATAADAQLILQLYDFRREAEMRKARNFIFSTPLNTIDEVLKIAYAAGTPENAWYRQVLGYWDMAASLVLRGAIHPDLFFDNSGEMYFLYAKLRPFIAELRQKMNSTELLARVEKVVLSSKQGRERLKRIEARLAQMQQRAAAVSKSS